MSAPKEGNWLAVADNSGLVHVLDAESYQTIETIHAHEEGCTAVLWHPEKSVLITAGKDAMIRCWNTADKFKQVFHFASHLSTVYDIIYHEETRSIVTCSRDKTVKWWNPDTFDPIHKIDYSSGGHKHSVNRLLAQGTWVISASDDRKVLLFGV
ncbi:MAG: WD40 repeat domain-containing protein [Flavobacteriales bacterium]